MKRSEVTLMMSMLAAAVFALSGCSATAPRAASMDEPIALRHHYRSMNSVGGVSYSVVYWNTSPKPLKYVDFTLTPFNAVGDVAPSSIGGRATTTARDTGPLAPGQLASATWEPSWYNSTIHCVRLDSVKLIFMDGTEQALTDKQVQAALGKLPRCARY